MISLKKIPTYMALFAFVLLVGTLVALSSIFQNVAIGEAAIGVFAIAALIFKIPSQEIFKMALITLVFIPVVTIFRPDSDIAETFAVYVYLLLVAGVVGAVAEQWRESRAGKNNNIRTQTGKLLKKFGKK